MKTIPASGLDLNEQIQESETQLRICCYGSSSPKTLQKYINDAYTLGYILCKRGHICVNGAGEHGCMGAMNLGMEETDGTGKVVGVIHEMFIKDRDRGICSRSSNSSNRNSSDNNGNSSKRKSLWFEGCAPVFKNCKSSELIVVGGDSLQQRKKKLVENIDALIVMPGGPGTFDELWEMACAKQIGLIDYPIVCVNIDGYYDPFYSMLQRAHKDQFLYKHPDEILQFESNSKKAIDFIESFVARKKNAEAGTVDSSRNSDVVKQNIVRRTSFMKRMMSTMNVSISFGSCKDEEDLGKGNIFLMLGVVFTAGLALGSITPLNRR